MLSAAQTLHGEAMLQLFNVNWIDVSRKMPEIAEAGYTSLWLPPPAKAGSVFSVGYDLFDPFDLGDKNQRGTVRTKYGTKSELLRMVETAHRFGIRVYFDNIMNHRGFDVPGYNPGTPTNMYPGLTVEDFHVRQQTDGTFRNWDPISDFNNLFEVQNRPLFGLIDLANEGGGLNVNFGLTEGSSTAKVSYVRQPGNPEYYADTALAPIAGPWRPFNGAQGDPVAEDLNAYLIRAAMWMVNETKCDGFRLDAVKHTPSSFFGNTTDNTDGYTGGLQTIFDYVHGYGNNLTGNGYVEAGGNRDSLFNTEAIRDDAMLFGEHLGEPPSFQEYIDRGMRLLNTTLHFHLNNVLGNPGATLGGLDQRDFTPYSGAIRGVDSVLFAQSHDDSVANRRELHNGYNFMREGLPAIYSDGYNLSAVNPGEEPFPRHANAPYLGQFGDNKMPDLAWLHHQVARGGTRARWSDSDIVAFERYDYREVGGDSFNNPDATVALFVMNDNYAGTPAGEISFDDGVAQTTDGTFYECFPVENSRGVGLAVAFTPQSVLYQLADSPEADRACRKLLVREATTNLNEAISTVNAPNPWERKVYVGGQVIPPGGGAIEFKVPSGSYVIYGYQGPGPSRAAWSDAITLHQGGAAVPRITVTRTDGVDGDSAFNPTYPFDRRGRIDTQGNLIGGTNIGTGSYAMDVPIITNAPVDIRLRADASADGFVLKLDGGTDLNSHLGLGPTNGFDLRDNRPGYSSDVHLGYEQTIHLLRVGPEKFGSSDTNDNTLTSFGADTYHYTVGGGATNVPGGGGGFGVNTETATWVYHDPSDAVTLAGGGPVSQRSPLMPAPGQAVDLWFRAGFQFEVNKAFVYYTVDGSNPEGAFGRGQGTTRAVEAFFAGDDAVDATIDWWKGTIPAADNVGGAQIRYKVAVHQAGIGPMSDAAAARVYGLAEHGITNFNPATTRAWLHNNLNTNHTQLGLAEGFHILRARPFLPRPGKSSVFNTFAQTFYYDAGPPAAVVVAPATDGTGITSPNFDIIIRSDATATEVEVNIVDSNSGNDDAVTGFPNGNGFTNGAPVFVQATAESPQEPYSQLHPNLTSQYRFRYIAVPSSGVATITVRLKEATSSILPDRIRTLKRTVNTLAPDRTLYIATPATNGTLQLQGSNSSTTILVCNTVSGTETSDVNKYSLFVNGTLLPRAFYTLLPTLTCGGGYTTLASRWGNISPGTNIIEAVFAGSVVLTDTRVVNITYPVDPNLDTDGDQMTDVDEGVAGTDPGDSKSVLRITDLEGGSRLIVWASVSNKVYQVHATTNLSQPFSPISNLIQAGGGTAFHFDSGAPSAEKFYRIEVVPQ